jgi:hypothetical protein
VVVAALREAATELAAEATVAESTHAVFNSILLNLNGQAGPTLPLAQFRLSLSSPFRCCHFRRAPLVFESTGI